MRSGRAAGGSRFYPHWWWLPLAGFLASLIAGSSAEAAVPNLGLVDHERPAPVVRVAQNGPLDGLFSIFKPKPKPQVQRLPDQPVTPRKAKAGLSRLPQTESTAIIGSDPAPISVRPAPRPRSASSGGSRTMCVRLCDGYYWPAGNATEASTIARDQANCQQSFQLFAIFCEMSAPAI